MTNSEDRKNGSESEVNQPQEDEISQSQTSSDGGGGDGVSTPSDGNPPSDRNDGVDRVSLIDEVEKSYLGYAMSVIIGRALPDVRDGLKPVQRRCLFAMQGLRNYHNRPTIKSARVSGEVSGKFHPHGEVSVYETMVRMAQEFSMRYPLVEGQGNFGSVDGDQPAAPRYTEMRMQEYAAMLLADIDEETVDFEMNYDETLEMPTVLPTRVPNLLLNGSDGIAVAIATKMPPHNLGEVVDACIATINDPEITLEGLMEHIQGPDFPTGAIINGRAGIVQAYRTGRGSILVRAKAEIVQNNNQEMIVVTELPYQVNKANLIKKIAELVKRRPIEGISDLRDESDKDGLRIAIEIKRGEIAETILNQLYKYTDLQIAYSFNCNALVKNTPKRVTLRHQIDLFIEHRREVIARRTQYRLRQNRARGHVIEGQAIALANIDEILKLIQASENRQSAEAALLEKPWSGAGIKALLSEAERDIVRPLDLEDRYGFKASEDPDEDGVYSLSPTQAKAIVEMQLHRLTNLESNQLTDNYQEVVATLRDLLEIQDSEERVNQIMIDELVEVREKFADVRQTEIRDTEEDLTDIATVKPQDIVITLSHSGYVKAVPVDEYSLQNRGGVGKKGVSQKADDDIQEVLITHSHNELLVFTNLGRVFSLGAHKIPLASRIAKGYPLIRIIPKLREDEKATYLMDIAEDKEEGYLFFATRKGLVKRTALKYFSRIQANGLKAVKLGEDDELIGVAHTDGRQDIMLVQSSCRLVRFKESDIRVMSRVAQGVRGIRMRGDTEVVGLIVPEEDGLLCLIDELGLGKRVSFEQFDVKNRGIQGRLVKKATSRLVSALQVKSGDHLMLLNEEGKFIRVPVDSISHQGVYANGVKVMTADASNKVIEVVRVPAAAAIVEDSGSSEDTEDSEEEAE